jgi:hypothetical protein
MKFLIIGGSDASIAAGLRAHELDPGCEITLMLADAESTRHRCWQEGFRQGQSEG